jgi:ribonucleoside-diphosphate reductase alpha chain
MINSGFPNEVDLGNSQNVIFSFPVAAPENAICRTDKTALQQLRFWKIYATTWCEHKPSITVSIKEHEWLEVGAWLHKNFHYLSGIAFLPFDDHVYQQAPYTDINQQQYKEMLMTMPTDIDWTGLATYEQEDNTIASQELACVGGVCEIF